MYIAFHTSVRRFIYVYSIPHVYRDSCIELLAFHDVSLQFSSSLPVGNSTCVQRFMYSTFSIP